MPQGVESRLSTYGGGISFTVNTAVTDVSLVLTGTPALSTNGVIMYFDFMENIIIKGFALCFPYQFGQGQLDNGFSNAMQIQLGWYDSAANSGSVDEVGDTGLITIPDPNYWYDMDIFVPCPSGAAAKWGLEIIGCLGEVSMINSPAALNTEVLLAQMHMKISHTLPMLA